MSSLSSAAAPARAAGFPLRLSNLGDELLARYAARGSDRAFAALYERYHQRLYRYCRSILRDDADAQDALQSTFAAALSALRRSQRSAPLRPWLYKIAHNEAISLLRRRTRDAADELRDETFGVRSSVEQEVTERARWRTLVADLGELPDRQRGALLLRELSGLSHEEIAIALGTTSAGAKQAIFEARQALSEIEEGRAMSCEDVRRRLSEGDRRVLRGRRMTAHLRECSACEAFAMAIPARRAELRAFTPVLPTAAAAAVLSRSLGAPSASAGGGAGGASTAAAAGVVGKAAGTALVWKTLAAVAVVAASAAGATGLARLVRHSLSPSPPASAAAVRQRADAAGRSHHSALGSHALARTASAGAAGLHRGAHAPAHTGRAGAASGSHSRGSAGAQAASRGKALGLIGNSHGQGARGNGSRTSGHQPATHGQGTRSHGAGAVGHQPSAHAHNGSAPGHQAPSSGQGAHGHSTGAPGHQPASQGAGGHSGSAPGQQPSANPQSTSGQGKQSTSGQGTGSGGQGTGSGDPSPQTAGHGSGAQKPAASQP